MHCLSSLPQARSDLWAHPENSCFNASCMHPISSILGIQGSCTGTGSRQNTCTWLKCCVVSAWSRIRVAAGTLTKPELLVNDLDRLKQRLISSAWWLGPLGRGLSILQNIYLYSRVSALYRPLFMRRRNKSESICLKKKNTHTQRISSSFCQ